MTRNTMNSRGRFIPRWQRECGQSVLELALLMPILCLLLLGIIEMGRYAEISILVSNAARAGAQYGAQNIATAGDSAGIQAAALQDAQISGWQSAGNDNCLSLVPVASAPLQYALCGCSDGTDYTSETNENCLTTPPPAC